MKSEQISLLHHSGQQKARVRTPNPNKWLGWAAEFLCHTCLLWASHIFMGKQFYPDTSPITVSIVTPPDNRAAVCLWSSSHRRGEKEASRKESFPCRLYAHLPRHSRTLPCVSKS